MEDEGQIWEVVGGGDKGGIMVREGVALNSPQEPDRLSTGALVLEIELTGERLWFDRLTGTGPDRGWVSTRFKDKDLVVKTDRRPTEVEAKKRAAERVPPAEVTAALAEASAGMAATAKFEAANDAFTAMAGVWSVKNMRPQLLMARGLLLWRWSLLGKALSHLKEAESQRAKGAPMALLALRLCLSQWPDARRSAEKLKRDDALALIDRWEVATNKMNLFFPEKVEFVPGDNQVMPGIRQTDMRIQVSEDVHLGARLLLQIDQDGQASINKPLVLVFHREEENVNTYVEKPQNFEPLRAAGASAIIIDYRGYGFSTGEPSQTWLYVDGDRVCDALPKLLQDRGLPWPWPGGLTLFGSSLGSRVACYLMGTRGQLFNGGVVIENAWCGSYALGAQPAPEPKEGPSLKGRFGQRVWNEDVNTTINEISALCKSLGVEAGVEHSDVFCYVRGSEDLVRGFDGRLLILHGEQEMLTEASHARRLCDAAESATRKLVLIPGKEADTIRSDAKYAEALKTFLSGC